MTTTQPAGPPVATTTPAMTTGEVLTRFDVVTDKMANRFDAAVDKVTTRLDTQADRLARIETKVDQVPADLAQLHTTQANHSARLRSLETRWSFGAGAAAVVALLLSSGVVVAIITAVHK